MEVNNKQTTKMNICGVPDNNMMQSLGIRAGGCDMDSLAGRTYGWIMLEEHKIPYVTRGCYRYMPVKILEEKFLTKYVHLLDKLKIKNPISSYFIHETEALILTSAGCGHIFSTQDLVVKLDDFLLFYEELKKAVNENSANKVSVVGGWVQINNTVMPYITKDDSMMVSLSILRGATGLLVGIDVPVAYPNEEECAFLNESCKKVGIAFDFSTTTELVELVLMSCMSAKRPFILELPKDDPFSKAQFVNLDEISNNTNSAVLTNNTAQVENRGPVPVLDYKVQSPEHPYMNRSSETLQKQTATELSCKEGYSVAQMIPNTQLMKQTLPSYSAATHTGLCPPAPIILGTLVSNNNPNVFGHMRNTQQENTALYLRNAMTAMLKNNPCVTGNGGNGISMQIPGSNFMSNINEAIINQVNSQTQLLKAPPMSIPSNVVRTAERNDASTEVLKKFSELMTVDGNSNIKAGENLLLRRFHCYGRTISCMLIDKGYYFLLEAMNRLYFPLNTLDTVIKVITQNFNIPTKTITASEERDFVLFYMLPTKRLRCKKVINVVDFLAYYPRIQALLETCVSSMEAVNVANGFREMRALLNQSPPSDKSSFPVPIGQPIPNLYCAETIRNSSRGNGDAFQNLTVTSTSNFPYQLPAPHLGISDSGQPRNLSHPQASAAVNNSSPPPKKPRRERVIGEVICIDD